MNCIYEVAGSVILHLRSHFGPGAGRDARGDYELCRAEDSLKDCRSTLWLKEQDLAKECARLGREAIQRRKAGDVDGARMRFRERKRQTARLEKMRTNLLLIERQLDALHSRELDREIMESLKLSSQAMKKAGIRVGVEDAEKVMDELDSQIRQSSELTTVLAAPVSDDTMDADMDLAELGLIEAELAPPQPSPAVVGAGEDTVTEEVEADEALTPRRPHKQPPPPSPHAFHRRNASSASADSSLYFPTSAWSRGSATAAAAAPPSSSGMAPALSSA